MPYRIFLVEDHPTMFKTYTQVFGRESDFEVCGTAGSAEEALVALAGTPSPRLPEPRATSS